MDAFAITGIAAGPQGDPEWFRVEGAVGGFDSPPKLFPRVQVLKRESVADLIAGGRIVYVLRPDEREMPDRARVRLGADGTPRIEAVTLGGLSEALDELPRFAFAAHASDDDIDTLRAIGRGESRGANDADRYLAHGWIAERADGTLQLTDIGRDLIRSRFM
jgi:hypothetical protein